MDILGIPLDLIPVLVPIVREVIAFIWWLLPGTVQGLILWQFVYLPVALFAIYPLAVQYERPHWWCKLLFPLYVVAGVLSAYLNYTTFALYTWDAPKKGENTFSQRCERLVGMSGLRGVFARVVARYTNRFDPSPPHIPLP